MRSNSALYPQSYYQLLLILPVDGTPKTITFPSADAAAKFRLNYYNFLKWCRRPLNAHATSHLGGRYNLVSIKLVDNTLQFALRNNQRFAEMDDALTKMFEAEGLTPPPVPAEFLAPTRTVPAGERTPLSPEPNLYPDAVTLPVYTIPSAPIPEPVEPYVLDNSIMPPGVPTDSKAFIDKLFTKEEQEAERIRLLRVQHDHNEEYRLGLIPKREGWYPKDTVMELSTSDRERPEAMLGRAIDVAVFEQRPYTISYPLRNDTFDEVDEAKSDKHFKLYADLLLDNGLAGAISIHRTQIGFIIAQTQEAERMLHKCGWPAIRLAQCTEWKDQNAARQEVRKLFLEHLV
jgi:hypothetical protein